MHFLHGSPKTGFILGWIPFNVKEGQVIPTLLDTTRYDQRKQVNYHG